MCMFWFNNDKKYVNFMRPLCNCITFCLVTLKNTGHSKFGMSPGVLWKLWQSPLTSPEQVRILLEYLTFAKPQTDWAFNVFLIVQLQKLWLQSQKGCNFLHLSPLQKWPSGEFLMKLFIIISVLWITLKQCVPPISKKVRIYWQNRYFYKIIIFTKLPDSHNDYQRTPRNLGLPAIILHL